MKKRNCTIWWQRHQNFYQHKKPISIKNLDINKTVVSNGVSFGKKESKYLIGYNDVKNVRPLCKFLLEMSAYRVHIFFSKMSAYLFQKWVHLKMMNY